jgi:hypothetical protein
VTSGGEVVIVENRRPEERTFRPASRPPFRRGGGSPFRGAGRATDRSVGKPADRRPGRLAFAAQGPKVPKPKREVLASSFSPKKFNAKKKRAH